MVGPTRRGGSTGTARSHARSRAAEPIRITEAGADPDEDVRRRQRRYLGSMALRTACVVGAVLTAHTAWMWAFLVGAVFLPYVAVVMANAAGPRDDGFRLVPTAGRAKAIGPAEERDDPGRPGEQGPPR